jgi:hypothetical protein
LREPEPNRLRIEAQQVADLEVRDPAGARQFVDVAALQPEPGAEFRQSQQGFFARRVFFPGSTPGRFFIGDRHIVCGHSR